MALENEATSEKRPIGVWVIVGVYTLAMFIFVPSIIFSINHHPEVFEQFSRFEVTASLASIVAVFVGVALLFFMRVSSFWVFVGITVVSILFHAIRSIIASESNTRGFEFTAQTIIELILWGIMLFYVWRLKAKGILK